LVGEPAPDQIASAAVSASVGEGEEILPATVADAAAAAPDPPESGVPLASEPGEPLTAAEDGGAAPGPPPERPSQPGPKGGTAGRRKRAPAAGPRARRSRAEATPASGDPGAPESM
jgi:hypothetical protein